MKLCHRTTGTISKGAKTLHWLAEHATKSAKYQFMKIFLDGRKRPYGKANIILKLIFVIQKGILRKKIQQRKTAGMSYIWFWVQWLVGHAPKSVQYKFTKLGRLTATHPKEGAKIILKILFLTRRPVFRKKQRALWIEKKSENVLYFILSVLASRARPKICYTLTNWLVWR